MAVLSSEDGPKVVRAPPVGPEEAKAVLAACAATYSKSGAAAPPEEAFKAVQKCTLPLYAKVGNYTIGLYFVLYQNWCCIIKIKKYILKTSITINGLRTSP